jgi:hypothetical protein
MAWSDTGDFTSGQILTAAAMDKVREAMFFGQATFTNEAARDTAFANPGALAPITLQEGMRSYLTAPTVPAASGGTTMVPTGATTVYNGTAWVCTTPVGAFTSNTGTLTGSTTFTPTLGGSPGTNPAVTLVTGTTALVSISALASNNAIGGGAILSVAVSGASTIAASADNAAGYDNSTVSFFITIAHTFIFTGLTAGTNTFTLNYSLNNAANTATFLRRRITVQGIA